MYIRMTVDAEELFTKVVRTKLEGYAEVFGTADMEVMGQQDVDSFQHIPFVVLRADGGRMLNGPGAWEWEIYVSIVANSRDDAADISDMVYRAMHESHDENVRIPGVGAVTSVDDVSMPSRTSTTLTPAGDLTQYDGHFHVIVRKL
jgi:hypothetical protein